LTDTPADTTAPAAPASRRRVLSVFALVALLVVAVDLWTKDLATARLADGHSVRVLGGLVYLLLVRNSGAAFSMGVHHTWVFPVVTVVVVTAILWTARRVSSVAWAVGLGLVLGGALGNLGDRLFRAPGPLFGHVVDFVSLLDPHGRGFPVFNVADAALCCGVGLILLLELTGRRRDGTRVRDSQA
jgi:signal peptidase II